MQADCSKALVVLSGGQDSTTCLYWAIKRFGVANVDTVTFDYGQRHRIELDSAARVARDAGVANTVLPIDTFAALGGDALTDAAIGVRAETDTETGLPNTFVPGRNIVFLTYAAALACDPVSAFGGIIAVNRPMDAAAAEAMKDGHGQVSVSTRTSCAGASPRTPASACSASRSA